MQFQPQQRIGTRARECIIGAVMPGIDAIVFDLYGTLLKSSGHSIHKEIPRFLGVAPRLWLDLVKTRLLTTPFPSLPQFVSFVCDTLVPGHDPLIEPQCVELVQKELDGIRMEQGVLPLLSFLKRRGYKLGLISNVSSSYKEPLFRFKLHEMFDAMAFSCDEGIKKPDPRIYLGLCRRLEVEPQRVLFVGDSLQTDVIPPRQFGMRTFQVGRAESHPAVEHVSELGWIDLSSDTGIERLLDVGHELRVEEDTYIVRRTSTLPDAFLGRYNLVIHVQAEDESAGAVELYCKRFLLPESVHVEEFAYRVQQLIGLPSCRCSIVSAPEPYLAVSAAPGVKYEGEMDPAIAEELGRHYVFAYLFSNADMRPRNAFIRWSGSKPILTFFDLEHCFFNLAIDTSSIADPDRPESLDRLGEKALKERTNRMVLTDRAMRRSLNTFLNPDSCEREIVRGFRRGFVQFCNELKGQIDRICGAIESRVYTKPYLIIGTHSYRRAMARIDVEDIRSRLLRDPDVVLDGVLASRSHPETVPARL